MTGLDEEMEPHSRKASRKPRADSLRNREKLLDAAREVFGAGGPGASLEAVARAAGVGIGTLYRHFPTREALFQAVYARELNELVDLAHRLPAEAGPAEALRRWLHANIRLVATKRGMLAALEVTYDTQNPFYAEASARLHGASAGLFQAAVEAGEIRDDLSNEDVMRAVIGIFYTRVTPDWQEVVTRLLDVFVDGLLRRPSAAG